MSDESDKKKAVDFFVEMGEQKGVAVSTVTDGHVILFKRAFLEQILRDNPGDELMLFVRRPDFKN
jgi:hypothetical protein